MLHSPMAVPHIIAFRLWTSTTLKGCVRCHYQPRTTAMNHPISIDRSTTFESRTGLETQIHRPCTGDEGMMLASGKEAAESCRHLRTMKLPEGGVLQPISALLFNDSKAPALTTVYSTLSLLLSSRLHDLPSSMHDTTRLYLFGSPAGMFMWAVCAASVNLCASNILVIIHFKFACH